MANSIDTRLNALEERAEKAETELRKLKGITTAHTVWIKGKDK